VQNLGKIKEKNSEYYKKNLGKIKCKSRKNKTKDKNPNKYLSQNSSINLQGHQVHLI
jgi:hypothetical protein